MKTNKKARMYGINLLLMFLAVVLAVAVAGMRQDTQRLQKQRQVEESLAQMTLPSSEVQTEEKELYQSPIDFEALIRQNPDVIGWIRIMDTRIDYPILYSGDNETYLHHTFDGSESAHGAIYLDADSESDFSGKNHPIYGHHMKDGSMFRDIVKFKDQTFFEQHRYFDIYTPERRIRLKTLACYYTDASGITRQTSFNSQEDFDAWTKERLEPCSFAELPEKSLKSMFVLVTCSYEFENARTLLFAAEVDEDGNWIEAEEAEGSALPESLSGL